MSCRKKMSRPSFTDATKVLRGSRLVSRLVVLLMLPLVVNGAACSNTKGTQVNDVASCTCGTVTCDVTEGKYCAASRNQCYASALPGPPKSVDVRVVDDDTLQVTIEPPIDDGGANITALRNRYL